MNRAEQTARRYLTTITSDVVYEPDGNIPPDFLLDGQVAVEVRGLNAHYFGGGKVKGLEQDDIKLERALSAVLRDFDQPAEGQGYWIHLQLTRPLGNVRKLQSIAGKGLRAFLAGPRNTPHKIILSNTVTITILRAVAPTSRTFRLGIYSDEDGGGMVAEIYIDNMKHCIQEKTGKITSHVSRYPRWWLVLIDYLQGLDSSDRDDEREIKLVKKAVTRPSAWERIVVVNPATGAELLDICQ